VVFYVTVSWPADEAGNKFAVTDDIETGVNPLAIVFHVGNGMNVIAYAVNGSLFDVSDFPWQTHTVNLTLFLVLSSQ
jgi:hypothetical protein